ncbi:G-protein coupled receptor 4-like [Labrus bergylta]|uniref:G-protein coupled receptor 4-like n=1 Tax=Labrus bergylta TaxID=56723 RepID=UPI0033136780
MADIISNTTLDGSYVQSDYDYVDYNDYVIKVIIYRIIYWITRIIICIDLPLTLIAIYALFTLVQNNHVAPIYVINLLIADIFQLCCIITKARWYFYVHEFSLIYAYIYSLMASVGFMVCLSLERYMVIAYPLKHCFMHSIKMSGVVCVVVWALPLVFLLPFAFRVDFHVTIFIFDLFFILPFPLLIFFLGGTLKALSASISVPSNEKRQTVGILVLLLLIYMLLFLPSLVWLMADSDRNANILSYKAFVFQDCSGVRNLSILFIRFSPLAHLVLCVFMSKGAIDKLLTSLGCCKMGGNDINITV